FHNTCSDASVIIQDFVTGISSILHSHILRLSFFLFFFNDPPTTEIYTLSLHDALPISRSASNPEPGAANTSGNSSSQWKNRMCLDRKSTRLNSSHVAISYAVFCLKKKNKNNITY